MEICVLHALYEPRVFVGCVSCYEVQHYLDAFRVGFFHEFDQVVVGAEAGVNAVKVNDVVTAVYPAGYENRVKPYGSYSEFFDVIEFRDNASDVADSVSVRIFV